MTPKQTTKHGKPCWTIDARSSGCGRLFADSKEAVLLKLRTKLSGVDKIKITDQDRLAKQELGDRGTLLEAVRFFVAHKPSGKRVPLKKACDECLDTKRKRGCRPAYLAHLGHILTQFQTYARYNGITNCCDANASHIEGFLDSKPWAASSRVGMRNRLSAFFSWSRKRGYCTLNPVDAVEVAFAEKTRPNIFSVEQVQRLLDTAHILDPSLLTYLALGLFCGLRPDELKRLPIEAVKVDRSLVDLPPEVTKTRDRRIVEISENARAWLRAARATDSPAVYYNRKRLRALCELAHVAWSPDVMRHSFASYHIALHQSADKTAMELGHQGSTKMLFRHYKATVTKEDAATFWQLEPVVLLTVVKEQVA